MREEGTALSDKERQLVQRVADVLGITFDEAATKLTQEGLANRVRKKTGRRPAPGIVRPFRR